jgi:hypothetical protein
MLCFVPNARFGSTEKAFNPYSIPNSIPKNFEQEPVTFVVLFHLLQKHLLHGYSCCAKGDGESLQFDVTFND